MIGESINYRSLSSDGDLFKDHPVNHLYISSRAGLKKIEVVRKEMRLYGEKEDHIECVSCHNPHTFKYPFTLHFDTEELCIKCHGQIDSGRHVMRSYGSLGSHPIKGVPDPLKEENDLSCVSCHNPHASTISILRDRNLCLNCHIRIDIRP